MVIHKHSIQNVKGESMRRIFFLTFLFFTSIHVIACATEKIVSCLGQPAFVQKGDFYEISLGSSLPLEGGISTIGKDFSNGLNMVFNLFNKQVQTHKKNIRLFSLDDHYSDVQGYKNIKTLREKMPIIIGVLKDKVVDLFDLELSNSSMGFWFGLSGAEPLFRNNNSLVINMRPSLDREIEGLVQYIVKKRFFENIAVFYEESSWGKSGLKSVEKYLKRHNIELRNACAYPVNTVHIKDALNTLIRVQPSAVICLAHARPTYNLIQGALSEGLEHIYFFGLSTVAPIQYLLKKSRGIDLPMSLVVPDPFFSPLPIVKKYREDMQRFFPYVALSPFSLEGYIVGKLSTHVIQKSSLQSTYAGLMHAFESIIESNFGGLDFNFNRNNRALSSAVWIKEQADKEAIQVLS
jgi:branched-chain amino acid transport system substrate-binding protein